MIDAKSVWNTPSVDLPYLRRVDLDSLSLRCKTAYYLMTSVGKPHKVIVWLHGGGGNYREMLRLVSRVYMKEMIRVKKRGESVMVIFPYCIPDLLWMNTRQPEWRVEDYVAIEVIKNVREQFKIESNTSWEIHGYSMGGYGALRIGMKMSHIFSRVLTMGAGPLGESFNEHSKGDIGIRKEIYRKVFGSNEHIMKRASPLSICKEMHESMCANQQSYRIVVGSEDGALSHSEHLTKRMSQLGVNTRLEVVPGLEHRLDKYLEYLGESILD